MRHFLSIVFCFLVIQSFSQISGPNPVNINQPASYVYSSSTNYNYRWTITNGVILSSSHVGSNYYVSVVWGTSSPGSLSFINNDNGVTVTSQSIVICTPPPTPNAIFSYSNLCGSTNITYSGSGGQNITWYWSTSSTDINTTNSTTSYSTNTDGVFYLRASKYCGASSGSTYALSNASQATNPVTVKKVPTATITNTTICSGTSVYVTNNVPSTTNIVTVTGSNNLSGASDTNGISGTTSPYVYNLNQILTAIGNVNGSVGYSVTPSANGCTGSTISATVTVKASPLAYAPNQDLFTGNTTNILLTDLNNVSGTTYNWTVSQSGVSGGTNGSGSVIGQVLTSTSGANGKASYIVNGVGNGCYGPAATVVATVYPPPVIIAPRSGIVLATPITMDAGSGYATYIWKNSSGVTVGTSQTYSTNIPDSYTATVTKAGVIGSATSAPFTLVTQIGGQQDVNHIVSNTLQTATTDASAVPSMSISSVNQTIQYYDGLGRTLQTVATQGSPSKLDVVQPVVYDAYNREAKKYLPFTAGGVNDGFYKPNEQIIDASTGNFIGIAQPFYSTGSVSKLPIDIRPFTETVFESSPLNRPLQQFGAGQDWKDNNKSVSHQYMLNKDNDVILFDYDPATGLVSGGAGSQPQHYGVGQLQAKVTTDEHSNDVIEFVDKLGRTVCKKVQYKIDETSGSKLYASTYYIYDDIGNLVVVLPPEAVKRIAPAQN